MPGAREGILQEITARLVSTIGINGRAYRSRAEAAARAETPCLIVTPLTDAAERVAVAPQVDRKLLVRIGVIVHGDTPDQAADPVIVDLHKRLIPPGDCTLGGLAVDISQAGDNFAMAHTDGIIAVDYMVFYRESFEGGAVAIASGASIQSLTVGGAVSGAVLIVGASWQVLDIASTASGIVSSGAVAVGASSVTLNIAGSAEAILLPLVTLSVAPVSVAEDGTANLVFTFERSGDASLPLVVTYDIGGTAAEGVDYQ
jgi:hypothetical protein